MLTVHPTKPPRRAPHARPGPHGLQLRRLAARAGRPTVAHDPRRTRHCILLWMTGGPTQTDTFDMKPGHANGGEFKEVATKAPGLKFSEHLPKLGRAWPTSWPSSAG